MIDPRKMCNKHLLGEHVETHMFAGTLRLKKSLQGYIEKGLFEYKSLLSRHAALAAELERRNFQHHSPLEMNWDPLVSPGIEQSHVDPVKSENDLMARCEMCRGCRNAVKII